MGDIAAQTVVAGWHRARTCLAFQEGREIGEVGRVEVERGTSRVRRVFGTQIGIAPRRHVDDGIAGRGVRFVGQVRLLLREWRGSSPAASRHKQAQDEKKRVAPVCHGVSPYMASLRHADCHGRWPGHAPTTRSCAADPENETQRDDRIRESASPPIAWGP